MTVEEQQAAIVLPQIDPLAFTSAFVLSANEAAYHADRTALNQGALKPMILQSPAHFFHNWTTPSQEEPTDSMRLGTWLHRALLEPELYASAIVRPKFGDGRKKEVKEAKLEWLNGCPPGSLIIDQDEKEIVEAMATNVLALPTARSLIEGAMKEATVYWVDKTTGILCRARIDVVSKAGILADVKTVEDASEEAHQKNIARGLYHVQAAHYLEAANAVAPDTYRDFLHIAVERNAPYEAAVYALGDRTLAKGYAARAQAMAKVKACITANRWPGYGDEVKPIELPPWALSNTARADMDF